MCNGNYNRDWADFWAFFTGIPIIETNIIQLDINELIEVQNEDEYYVNIKCK